MFNSFFTLVDEIHASYVSGSGISEETESYYIRCASESTTYTMRGVDEVHTEAAETD